MKKMLFYSDRPTARTHNRKTQNLADFLTRYSRTIFELHADFTADNILQYFQSIVAGLNQQYKGAEIKVRKNEIDGKIHYIFTEPKGDAVGELTLSNTLKHIDCEEDL